MNKQLGRLLELQKLNDQISDQRKLTAALKASIANQRKVLVEERAEIDEIKGELLENKKEQDRRELDLKSNEDDLGRLLGQLNLAKTNEEYSGLTKKIDEERRQNSGLEDEILELMGRAEEIDKRAENLRNDIDERSRDLDKYEKDAEDSIAQYNAKIETFQRQCRDIEADIDSDVLDTFRRVFERHDGDVMALADRVSQSCGGCNMHLMKQTINEVLGDNGIIFCKSCNRILYIPDGPQE